MFSIILRKTCSSSLLCTKLLVQSPNKYFSHRFDIILEKSIYPLRKFNIKQHKDFSTCNIVRQRAYDVNTKVQKDVILFKYENPKFYTMLNIFAICQFFFWGYLGNFAYTCLKDAPVTENPEDVPWWRRINLGENKYRNTLTLLCLTTGYGILAVSWLYTLKSVRYLILRKGGEAVTIVTYGPFGKNRMMTVDLANISCQQSRQNARVQLPLKVRNRYLHYLLDMKGEFKNVKLFDYTAGLKRLWK